MPRRVLGEVLIDLQTIVLVGLLYGLLREEQANAFLRTWLSNNLPLGLYLLTPLTVAAISGSLIAITALRMIRFLTDKNVVLEGEVHLRRLNMKKRLREFVSARGTNSLALVLSIFGMSLTLYSYLIVGIVPLAALGISCIILGFTAVSLPRQGGGGFGTRAMLQGATLSVEALLDRCTVRRATYLPPSVDGLISAYIPLGPETGTLSKDEMRQAPKSLVSDNQKGVLVYPIGSVLTRIPEFQNGISLEERIRYILVESADICSQVIAEETRDII